MSQKSDLIIRIGGEGGEGIISSGDILSQAAAKAGLEVLTFKTFPAEIRGGYAMYQIRMSSEKVLSEGDGFQVLVVFNKEALDANLKYLQPGNVLIWDGPEGGDIGDLDGIPELEGVITYSLPMSHLAKNELGVYRSKNMIAMGAVAELFDVPLDRLKGIVATKFGKKGQEIVDLNHKAIDMGVAYVKENHSKKDPYKVVPSDEEKDNIIIAGNDAVGMGAMIGGCDFFACYPITPATEIAYWVAKHLPKGNGVVMQTEDEISSIAAVIGASFAGAKPMTGTSGPGLALMIECLGLGSMVEAPMVICDVQRGGPSTGLPTKHETSDLFLACYGGHGDASRVVLAAENVNECVWLAAQAFNIAEHYQIPVILLSDGSMGFRTESIPTPDPSSFKRIDRKRHTGAPEDFARYKFTEDNISPTAVPGMEGCAHMQTGLEHNEKGSPNYGPEYHTKNIEKRYNKLNDIEDFFESSETDIQEGATLGVITFGSTQGCVREAVNRARAEGVKVSVFHPKLVYPMPMKALNAFLDTVDELLVPEVNYQGQLAEMLRTKTTKPITQYNIYGGLPFEPKDIVAKIKEVLS